MSKKDGKNSNEAAAGVCRCEGCKKGDNKFGFCQEHYEMYMSGVIRGDGTKPTDYEKKLEQFLAGRKAA